MENLILIHRPLRAGSKNSNLVSSEEVLVWTTCLRQIALTFQDSETLATETDDQVFKGLEACVFLLEVICGLHSPIVGETEVQGQFKQFLQTEKDHAVIKPLYPLLQKILSESKFIREKYLYGSGSQSYGSLIRKMTTHNKSIGFLGAGQLVQEILPWVKELEVQIFARNSDKAQSMQATNVSVHALDAIKKDHEVLVIAAPLKDAEILDLLSGHKIQLLIDLRGGESLKTVYGFQSYLNLEAFMELFKKHADFQSLQKEKALGAIDEWKEAQKQQIQIRPFGWEDVCA